MDDSCFCEMSIPQRQHSLRDRLHHFGLALQGKKDDDSEDNSKVPEDCSPTTVKCGYVNPLVDDGVDTIKCELKQSSPVLPSEVSMKPLGYSIENDRDEDISGMLGKRSMSIAYSDKERKTLYRQLPRPLGTSSYIVQSSDTLAGIAARHHTTPSELVKVNKLSSRLIFPGQRLFVPNDDDDDEINATLLSSDKDSSLSSQPSPKPGHVERIHSPTGNSYAPHHTPSFLAEELDKECLERFLKIKTRYITDGEGVVAGVLIVTPNVLMFDPNVSDPLVIEHGSDKYGVIVPMEMVIRVALYWDIARMALKNSPRPTNTSKTDVYHATRPSLIKSRSEENETSPTYELQDEEKSNIPNLADQNVVLPTNGENLQIENVKSTELTRISEEALIHPESTIGTELNKVTILNSHCVQKVPHSNVSPNKKAVEISETTEKNEISERNNSRTESELSSTQGLKTLLNNTSSHNTELNHLNLSCEVVSDHKHSTDNSSHSFNKNADVKLESMAHHSSSKVPHKHSFSKSAPVSEDEDDTVDDRTNKALQFRKIRTSDPSLIVYKNMVENKLDLFKSLEELVPRPAQSCEDSPLYLCIRMGRRISKSLPRSSPIMDYGKMKLKKEHWFSIPRDRVDGLYFFLQRWMPNLYGDIDDVNAEDIGFIPITSDEEDEEDSKEENNAMQNNHLISAFELAGVTPPELLEKSDILNEQEEILLCKHLPARAVGYPWTLIYSTSKHGFSLKTLYREMAKYETPVLLVIANTLGDIFGAMLSCTLRLSEHFYGTGESFLFTFTPEFKCYHWTGENMYFVKGNPGSLAIGAGDGQFGLWLDDDLFHGRSNECKTFGNDTLTKHEDFVVKTLEAWGFV